MSPNLSSTQLSLKEALDYYENGKHRRYALLFAVNGGAFAVAKLFAGEASKTIVLGNLTLPQLAFGMALFNCVMVWDIFVFGERVRTTYLEHAFSAQGKTVLLLVGALQLVGWLLVSGVGRGGA